MAYFSGQWKIAGARSLDGLARCVINFTAGGEEFAGIVISPAGYVSFIDSNGEYTTPEEEYGNDIIDFGEGVLSTSIDTGFCVAFLNRFTPYTGEAEIIGIEPVIYIEGGALTISARANADAYKLYVDGLEVYEFTTGEIGNSIDLTDYITDDGDESHNINVTAYFEDDVIDSEGHAIPFESAMSNTAVYSLNPDEPSEPDEPTKYIEYIMRESALKGIADAIRAKRGTEDPIDAADFAKEILQIDSEAGNRAVTTALDFTNYANGSFTETLSNGLVLTHTIAFDGETPTCVDNIELSGV